MTAYLLLSSQPLNGPCLLQLLVVVQTGAGSIQATRWGVTHITLSKEARHIIGQVLVIESKAQAVDGMHSGPGLCLRLISCHPQQLHHTCLAHSIDGVVLHTDDIVG